MHNPSTHVLIIASDTDSWHTYETYAGRIKHILSMAQYQSTTVLNLGSIKQDGKLDAYHTIVFCGRFPERDDVAEKALERFVHSGKGLIVLHIASSSFEFSPRWRKLVGRVWEYGGPPPFTSSHPEPPGPFQVNIQDRNHVVTQGLDDFDVTYDERYQDLLVAPNAKTRDLAFATLGERTEPVVWILTPPNGGRVLHITLGHDLSTYDSKGFQTLLTRGVAWTAGLL